MLRGGSRLLQGERVLLVVLLLASTACRYADAGELDFSAFEVELLRATPQACTGLAFGIDGEGYVSSGTTVYRFMTQAGSDADPASSLEPWVVTGAPRGHAVLADGDHVLCDGAGLLRISPDGQRRAALGGTALTAPRDLCVVPGGEGVLVVADGDGGGALWYVALATGEAVVLDAALAQPTGVALSPDGRTLYVTESVAGRVLGYDLSGPSSIGPRRELATLPPDEGSPQDVCVDADGFLWIARGSGIDILGADGRHVARLPTPAITSLAFGDASLRVLFSAGDGANGGGTIGRSYVGIQGAALPAQARR